MLAKHSTLWQWTTKQLANNKHQALAYASAVTNNILDFDCTLSPPDRPAVTFTRYYNAFYLLFRAFWSIQIQISTSPTNKLLFLPLLSVCLSVSKINQKSVHGFGRNVACRHCRVDRCRDMDELINFWARSGSVQMPEPTGLLSPISYRLQNFAALPIRCQQAALLRGILRRENPR